MNLGDIVCVILCGGKGKRMGSSDLHKVCFPIAGKPAICRTIKMFKDVGVTRFLIVIGQKAESVISTITAEHPDVAFVHQPQPRGTGDAAACAANVLKASGHEGGIIVTMGDKMVQPHVVSALIERHTQSDAAMTVAALPKGEESTAGRVVVDSAQKPVAIVEVADIAHGIKTRRSIRIHNRRISARRIEQQSTSVNASLYMFNAPDLYTSIESLRADNAQGELYLTDTVEGLVSQGKNVVTLEVPNPEDLMAFNTPAELLAIEEVFAQRLTQRRRISPGGPRIPRGACKEARQWLQLLSTNPPALKRKMTEIYGPDTSMLAERRQAFASVLKEFIKEFGPRRKVIIARAPGRINLMGRHVDHRGGFVNPMAINREVVMVAAHRDDDVVTLRNLSPDEFPRREFHIGELLRTADWLDWMDFINSSTVRQVLDAHQRGDWSNYAKAAVLRLQHACPDYLLKGMDCVVSGNIPMGAGLSSSSAVVVAVAEATVALNSLDVTPQQFVDLCGEGEWFVGSRGGSADHAAIRSGKRSSVARVGFFPFRIEEMIAFPSDLNVVVANSHIRAAKSAGARDTFNHRVGAFNIAEMLLKLHSPILASMQHLRDVNPEALKVSPSEIYRALKRLPTSLTRRAVMNLLPDRKDRLEELFSSHRDIGPYRPRDVAMYGISECLRSDRFALLLKNGDLDGIGELMRISHDGDRVARFAIGHKPRFDRRKSVPFAPSYSDSAMDKLIRMVDGQDSWRRTSAMPHLQSGRYSCSTSEIDFMVDLACSIPGVIGAQIAGAGLGGCTMMLVRSSALDDLLTTLKAGYYNPLKLDFDVHVCRPVGGSGILRA